MIKHSSIKNAALLFLIFFSALFFSCTFNNENRTTGKVSFSVGKLLQNQARSATTISSSDIIEVSLHGDYEEIKTANISQDSTIVFEEVPLEAEIYAEVYVYFISAVGKRRDKLHGISETIIVGEEENILTVRLKPIEKTENISAYTVIHKYQNIDDDDYTEEIEVLEGKTSALTNASAKTVKGFTAKPFDQQRINEDDSTVINIYYDRNVYTVKYEGGFEDVTGLPSETSYRYGATVNLDFETEILRPGYNFAGWKSSDGTIYKKGETTSFVIQDKDVTLTAQWTVSSNTQYIVKHLQQNINDDNYTEVISDRETKSGNYLDKTTAEAKIYNGFVAQDIEQKTIAADNSTIVEIKYTRKTYKVTYEDGLEAETISVPDDSTIYRYGASVTLDFTTGSRNGYTFAGWKNAETETVYPADTPASFVITSNVTLYAQWQALTYSITYHLNGGNWADGYEAPATYTFGTAQNLPGADKVVLTGYGLTGWYTTSTFDSGTKLTEINATTTGNIDVYAEWTAGAATYKVHHLQQNVSDDDYTEIEDDLQILAGVCNEESEAVEKSYSGFTAITPIEQKIIAVDCSTEITIKYNRNLHTVTYAGGKDADHGVVIIPSLDPEGIPTDTEEFRYGATVTVDPDANPTLQGYSFVEWIDAAGNQYSGGDTFTIGDSDVVLTAKWEPDGNVEYKIKYMQQNVSGEDYSEVTEDTTTKYGITGENTLAANFTKDYDGFVMQTITEKTILPDGSTAVEIKYNRRLYTVVYDKNAGTETVNNLPSDTDEYRFEANINLKNVTPTRTGYKFKGWTLSIDGTGTVYKYGDIGPQMIPSDFESTTTTLTLYAQWEVENQNTNINAGFDVDTSTISVSQSGAVFTAEEDSVNPYSYSWEVDGTEQSTTSSLDMTSIANAPGVYDIKLTATRTIDGNTVTYTWAGQYIK